MAFIIVLKISLMSLDITIKRKIDNSIIFFEDAGRKSKIISRPIIPTQMTELSNAAIAEKRKLIKINLLFSFIPVFSIILLMRIVDIEFN